MKIFTLIFFVFLFNCKQPKSENKQPIKTDEKVNLIEEIQYQELIVVLENPTEITSLEEDLQDIDLDVVEIVANKNLYKAAIIKIPLNELNSKVILLENSKKFSLIALNSEDSLNNIKFIAENTLVSVLKTECFGDCPVFEVIFFKNGKVSFYGKKFVLVKGRYEFTLEVKELKKLKELFNKTVFNKFTSAIDSEKLKDYSNTYIMYDDQKIMVKLWRNIPDEIAYAYDYIEELLLKEKLIE